MNSEFDLAELEAADWELIADLGHYHFGRFSRSTVGVYDVIAYGIRSSSGPAVATFAGNDTGLQAALAVLPAFVERD